MRDSPLCRAFPDAGFTHGPVGNMRVALTARHADTAPAFLADLSALAKQLVVGGGAEAWLGARGWRAPDWTARAVRDDGCWAVRTGAARYLLGESPQAAGALDVAPGRVAPDTLVLAQDHAEMVLGGPAAADVLGEFCGIDLDRCDTGRWLPLLCAQVESALCVLPRGAARDFHLFCAPADAAGLCRVLLDALRDAGGAPIGFNDYLAIASRGGQA